MKSPRPVPGFASRPDERAAELLEDQALLLERDPRPLVADAHLDRPLVGARDHRDLRSRPGVLDRVRDQVVDELAQPLGVAADRRQRATDLGRSRTSVLAELRRGHRLAHEPARRRPSPKV